MKKDIIVLIAEDDEGHAKLMLKNLRRAGIHNEIRHFPDGQQVLDFLLDEERLRTTGPEAGFLLLLDIRMPKVDGVTVLKRVKETPVLRRIPVIMITTTDDPREVARCHELGCSIYITKPVDYDKFVDAIRRLGLLLEVIQVPGMKAA